MSAVIMLMLGLLIIALSLQDFTVAQIGVAYGRNGDRLPPPSQVVQLYNQYNIQRMRIYDTDPEVLTALRGSNIELTVGVAHSDLQRLSEDPACANAWVRDNIMNYPDVKFRNVIVGNEVSPLSPTTHQYAPFVLGAMQNIYNAISTLQCGGIKVTTAVGADVIDPSSNFPPDEGRFRTKDALYLDPIIGFLVDTDTLLFANIYPYFAYINDTAHINISYALLDPNYPGVVTSCGTTYKNLFYALLDTVNAALEKRVALMSFGDATVQKPKASAGAGETGHATKRVRPRRLAASSTDADGDDDFANIENARAYVNNLIQAVKTGTPMRPGKPIETYIFAMFDENQKTGNEEERNFGLFKPDGCPKYPVNFD